MTSRRGLDTSILDDIGMANAPTVSTPSPAPVQPMQATRPANSTQTARISVDVPVEMRTALRRYALEHDTTVVEIFRNHITALTGLHP